MIEADALFLHLNPLQEAVQAEGDRDWRGLLRKLEKLVTALETPVVVKEVGNGIAGSVVRSLVDCGVSGIDVAGAGGTSWSEVEAHRQSDPVVRCVAHSFAGWIENVPGDDQARATAAFRRAVSRRPSEAEVQTLLALYRKHGSWFSVAQVILNLDETITKS